ncbi:hypothetical protein J4421_00640 [Candidatus Woesearchaeota archaeon]|nr:hypothetical protein [Candidatus Woesearchaeota archaeon]
MNDGGPFAQWFSGGNLNIKIKFFIRRKPTVNRCIAIAVPRKHLGLAVIHGVE